jgi:hypothetical protein
MVLYPVYVLVRKVENSIWRLKTYISENVHGQCEGGYLGRYAKYILENGLRWRDNG